MEYQMNGENTRDDVSRFVGELLDIRIPEFAYSFELEEFKDFTIGCCIGGNKCSVGFMAHELSHLAELEDSRRRSIDRYGLGLRSPKPNLLGFIEQSTNKAVERECRVVAIERHLIELTNNTTEDNYFEKYSRILYLNLSYTTSVEDVLSLIENNYEKYTKEYVKNRLSESLIYIAGRRKKFISKHNISLH